jgi:hypothetical protein
MWTSQLKPSDSQASWAQDLAIGPKGAIYTIMADEIVFGGNSSSFIRRYNHDGKVDWTRQIDTDRQFEFIGELIAVDKAGDIIVPGHNSQDSNQAQMIKYSRDGRRLWIRLISGRTINDIAVDEDANIYIVGKTAGFKGESYVGERAFAGKYDSDGKLLWKYIFEEEGVLTGVGIGKDNDLYVTGFENGKDMPAFLARFRR